MGPGPHCDGTGFDEPTPPYAWALLARMGYSNCHVCDAFLKVMCSMCDGLGTVRTHVG